MIRTPNLKLFAESMAARLGWSVRQVSHTEKWLSAVGGFVGVAAVALICSLVLPAADTAWIVASVGASAVLLFATPHGLLSQPWPLIGGHVVSAVVGVACSHWVSPLWFAASTAVGLAIAAMYYLRCLHPPGGSTALIAVLGGASIQDQGFHFVITPVLINALVILLTAFIVNVLIPGRRYPAKLMTASDRRAATEKGDRDATTLDDLLDALRKSPKLNGVLESDLKILFSMASKCQSASSNGNGRAVDEEETHVS